LLTLITELNAFRYLQLPYKLIRVSTGHKLNGTTIIHKHLHRYGPSNIKSVEGNKRGFLKL